MYVDFEIAKHLAFSQWKGSKYYTKSQEEFGKRSLHHQF